MQLKLMKIYAQVTKSLITEDKIKWPTTYAWLFIITGIPQSKVITE